MKFAITYKIGKGQKSRSLEVTADDIKMASSIFLTQAPAGAIAISIEPINDKVKESKPKDYYHLMKINNELDQFIVDQMREVGLSNAELLERLEFSKGHWSRNRAKPEKFRVWELRKIAVVLKVPFIELMKAIEKSLS